MVSRVCVVGGRGHVIVGPEMLAPCRVELGVYFVLVESLRPDGFFQVLLYGEP